jgi:hypothetical protein
MDQVIADYDRQGIIVQQRVVNAFRCFLVAKPSGAARFIMDLSPWTAFYAAPLMRLYSAAEVLSAIPQDHFMIKLDLVSGFFQIPIKEQYQKFYSIYYRKKQYAHTRLPMSHPLAPSILQRLVQRVAAHLHHRFAISMVAYLDDWLIFGPSLPVQQILDELQHLGLIVNLQKSVIQPAKRLIYLGLDIDLTQRVIKATPSCLQHLLQLLTIVPQGSPQDLRRITGYLTWLCWAMNWPMFIATLILQRDTYWARWMFRNKLLQQPRKLQPPLRSQMVYTDATPSSIGVLWPELLRRYLHRSYNGRKPIAFAELAAALVGLVHTANDLLEPTTITLATDSSVVFYVLSTGKGSTLRQYKILQELYMAYFF